MIVDWSTIYLTCIFESSIAFKYSSLVYVSMCGKYIMLKSSMIYLCEVHIVISSKVIKYTILVDSTIFNRLICLTQLYMFVIRFVWLCQVYVNTKYMRQV